MARFSQAFAFASGGWLESERYLMQSTGSLAPRSAPTQGHRSPGVRLLLGDDPLLRREAIAAHTRAFLGPGHQGASETFDLSEHALQQVLAAASCLSMFAPKQVIVVHNVAALPAAEHADLLRYCEAPAAGTLLLLLADKLDARLQLSKACKRLGLLEPLVGPAKTQLPSWLIARARADGVRLEPSAAALLVARVGDELALLAERLATLALYVGERHHIERADVLALIAPTREASIFALTDAVASGPWAQASGHLAELLADGEQPLVVLSMLIRQVRLLLAAQSGPPAGVPPFVADALVRRASHLPRTALRRALVDLQRADQALKQSLLPPGVVLERAIWPLAQAARSVRPARRGPRG